MNDISRHALNWIGGTWVASDQVGSSINPATYEPIGTDAGLGTARSAIAAARQSFETSAWPRDRHLRAKVLHQMADAFERNTKALNGILSTENGRVRCEALFEVSMVPSKLRYYASLVRTEFGRAVEPRPSSLSVVIRQPMGVAGVIAPWNSPVVLMIRSLAPAFAAGTTAVIKTPSQTVQTNHLIAKTMAEAANLPPSVVNLFTETGHAGSSLLIDSPDVPTVSFIGSIATGRAISEVGSKRRKRFGLELGGKTPIIVFDDADLGAAAPKLEKALTVFAGQFCMTGSRILAQRGVADRLRDMLARRFEVVKVGPASDPASEMGPLIDKLNVERVNKAVEDPMPPVRRPPDVARDHRSPDDDRAGRGIRHRSYVMQTFEDEAEAVQLANDGQYGLAASIWSRGIDRPVRTSRQIEAGTIWINNWAVVCDEAEEDGYKQSGIERLNGVATIEDSVEYRTII